MTSKFWCMGIWERQSQLPAIHLPIFSKKYQELTFLRYPFIHLMTPAITQGTRRCFPAWLICKGRPKAYWSKLVWNFNPDRIMHRLHCEKARWVPRITNYNIRYASHNIRYARHITRYASHNIRNARHNIRYASHNVKYEMGRRDDPGNRKKGLCGVPAFHNCDNFNGFHKKIYRVLRAQFRNWIS